MAKNIDGPLYYERMGRTGPVMAFVHPNPMDQSCWIFQMAQMSTWYRCIAIDVPGYGRSPKCRKGVTMNDVAQGCWEAIDEIAPGENAILVGCSVGSAIISYMHHIRPAKTSALILSGTGYNPGKAFAHQRIADYKKYGIDFRRQGRNFYQVMAPRGLFVFSGLYTGDGLADLMTGIANYTEQDFLQGNYPTLYWDLAGFAQDDWRILPNLTLNIGLRYEVTSPAGGRVSNFNLQTGTMDVGYGPGALPRAGVQYDLGGLAPRIGLAYTLPRNTVIRSAFGIFHSAESNIFDDLGLNPPQDTFNAAQYSAASAPVTAQLISTGFPDTFPPYDPNNLAGSVKTTGSKRIMPKILEWNLTVQRLLPLGVVRRRGIARQHGFRLRQIQLAVEEGTLQG
jgi:pimeloyl-ACP methyl ester carboxylesterase